MDNNFQITADTEFSTVPMRFAEPQPLVNHARQRAVNHAGQSSAGTKF
jgi:hypothetical protein